MMWGTVFGAVNLVAVIAWAGLILLPRRPALLAGYTYAGVGLLCLVYTVGILGIIGGGIDPGGSGRLVLDFSSIEGVRAIFASDGGVTVGWTHYLAFDLFIGLWIARDADHKGFSRLAQVPVLLATFMAGPVGLGSWLVLRERRARANGRWS